MQTRAQKENFQLSQLSKLLPIWTIILILGWLCFFSIDYKSG